MRYENKLHVVSDPFRRPQDIYGSLISPIGTLVDKIKVGLFSVLIRFKGSHTFIDIFIDIYIHIPINTHTHTYIYSYIHILIHTC